MDESRSQPPTTGRVIVIFATLFLILTCWWTLQAFVPEPYFLRLPYQLRAMSTPNGFGQVECSLMPFYSTLAVEAVVLSSVAVSAWFSKKTGVAVAYLLAIIAMVGITFWRLAEAFQDLR